MVLVKYIRLSSQDDDCCPGEKLESNSVTNQRSLLDHYIASRPDLASCCVLEFIDDGHTGTNFDRPGVQALFAAVKRGEISCIVVKDLSRFGRAGSEVGEYLERIFPLLQVRFIAINDGYDSKSKQYGAAGDLDVGMRNITNELYSRSTAVSYSEIITNINSAPLKKVNPTALTTTSPQRKRNYPVDSFLLCRSNLPRSKKKASATPAKCGRCTRFVRSLLDNESKKQDLALKFLVRQ